MNRSSDSYDRNVLESLHKAANFKVVVPIMAALCTAFVLAHFSLTFNWYLAVGLGISTVLLNAWYVTLNPVLRWRGREWKLRSDRGDAIRWIINLLVTDVPIMFLLQPSKIPMFGMWTLLIFSIFFEIYRNKYRLPVTIFGLACSAVTLTFVHRDTTPLELSSWLVTISCVLVFFYYVEQIWLSEAMRRLIAQEKEQHTAQQAERLHRKAIIGEHARTIAHEVSNLTMAINLAVHNPANINVAAIKRSSDYLKRIVHLVLEDLKATPMVRRLTVADLLSDVNVLLRKQVEMQDIDWSVSIEPEIQAMDFQERAGSTYFVLQNLIRNAIEAIHQKPNLTRGRISVSVVAEGGWLCLVIEDNGIGMNAARVQALLSGHGNTTKSYGHGIGMRFVLQELRRNGFSMGIQSVEGVGTTFRITVPKPGDRDPADLSAEAEISDQFAPVQDGALN